MIRVNQFDVIVTEIKKNFYSLIQHPYLESYIVDPEVDEDKVRFMYAILQDHLPTKDVEMFTISTLLVQAALDVHEVIPPKDETTGFARKNQQLTILAGDYYSSLYYYLLAKNEHLPMVQVFSHTIQEINEFKMNIYHAKDLSFEEVKKNVVSIESILLQRIAKRFKQTNWIEILKDYFYLKRLLLEKNEWLAGKENPLVRSLLQEVNNIDEVPLRIERKVEELKDRLLQSAKALGSYESFVIELIDDLIRHESSMEKVVEER